MERNAFHWSILKSTLSHLSGLSLTHLDLSTLRHCAHILTLHGSPPHLKRGMNPAIEREKGEFELFPHPNPCHAEDVTSSIAEMQYIFCSEGSMRSLSKGRSIAFLT